MKKEQIQELFARFEAASGEVNGVECWSARELQEVFGYAKWSNSHTVIDKAKEACEAAGEAVSDHFAGIGKMVVLGSGSERMIEDIALTRYACYLIAQNGDPAKPAIAFAQTYFAVQTRKQEVIEQRLLDVARVTAREKLMKSEKKLSGIIYERGVDHAGFAVIRSNGDQALFGASTNDMKRKLGAPDGRPLADFLSTLAIKAKDFATEMTSHNVLDKDLHGTKSIGAEHVASNKAVRNSMLARGIKPEELPPGEDVKKVERRLKTEAKQVKQGVRRVGKKKP
jgi:DNA-damage-inducible protein D